MDDAQIFISFHSEVSFVRMIEESILPVRLKIDASIIPDDDSEVDEINNVFVKVKTWLDNILSMGIAFSATNETAIALFVHDNGMPVTDNTVLISPGEPTDELLCALIHAKLNALGDGVIEFVNTKVVGDSDFRLSFCFEGDANDILPPHDEWLSNETFFDKPWWNRNDGTTHDFPCEDSMVGIEPLWAINFVIPDDVQEPTLDVAKKPKAKVQFAPIVIKGGKRKP